MRWLFGAFAVFIALVLIWKTITEITCEEIFFGA